jgi:glycosyltransferase involved in cell wall biosynthesis
MTDRAIRVLEFRSVRGTGGGPEKTILLGASRSDRDEFAITVCYLRDARDQVFRIDERARALGVDYVEVPERHSFDLSSWSRLRALVRERRIEIVHAHEYKTDLLAWLLARAEGIRALATVHGWTGHSSKERFVYYPVDKQILRRFPRLIAVSSQIREELIRHGAAPDRVQTILNGIDAVAFRRDRAKEAEARAAFGLAADAVVIGSVGRLEPQKRFDLLIEAFAACRPSHPRLVLVIAGEGSERARLSAVIQRLGLESSCRLLGHCTDVGLVHHACDYFVQSSDYEGTPNSVLEAMAFETPVVATVAGGTAELVRDGIDGLLTPIGDVPALTRAIERALGEQAETRQRVASARRRVETDLSFDARTRAVERVYRDLAPKREQACAS